MTAQEIALVVTSVGTLVGAGGSLAAWRTRLKDEMIAARDAQLKALSEANASKTAQLELLQTHIRTLQELSPKYLLDHVQQTKQGLEAYIEDLRKQLDEATHARQKDVAQIQRLEEDLAGSRQAAAALEGRLVGWRREGAAEQVARVIFRRDGAQVAARVQYRADATEQQEVAELVRKVQRDLGEPENVDYWSVGGGALGGPAVADRFNHVLFHVSPNVYVHLNKLKPEVPDPWMGANMPKGTDADALGGAGPTDQGLG